MAQGILNSPHHVLEISITGTADQATATIHTYHPADGESHVTSGLNGTLESLLQQLKDYLLGTPDDSSS